MVSVAHVNVRSLTKHLHLVKDYVENESFDVLAVTETWLSGAVLDEDVKLNGYNFIRADRSTGQKGGGVGIFIKNTFSYHLLPATHNEFSEQLWIRLNLNGSSYAVGVVYRLHHVNINLFVDTLEDILSEYLLINNEVICLGDFNIDLLKISSHSSALINMVYSLGLNQVVHEATRMGPTGLSLLDLIITSFPLESIHNVSVIDLSISDHFLTRALFRIDQGTNTSSIFKNRNFSNFN